MSADGWPALPPGLSEGQRRVVQRMLLGQRLLLEAFEAMEAAAEEASPAAAGQAVADAGPARFAARDWQRPGGGGGSARVIERGRVFERGGVNVSCVQGERVPPTLAASHPGTEGRPWFATGLSMVLHPVNPYVPAFHANFRYFEVGGDGPPVWWFGGGADLTPSYPVEAEVHAFHQGLADWCARHPQADHEAWKAACDHYFHLRHRGEARGVGGVFFDELSPAGQGDFEADLACVSDGLDQLLPLYLPFVQRHHDRPYGQRERDWQALRRGRYAEFNLVYDRGTRFGLQTDGYIEAILMSLPPVAAWAFEHRPEPGSPEAEALRYFQPWDWSTSPPRPLTGR